MLKFIKQNLDTIENIEWYPLFSLLLFFTVFISMIFIVIKIPKSRVKEDSYLPLDDDI